MEDNKKELKKKKKAYRKARGKATRPWKALTWISGPLAIISVAAMIIVSMFDNSFSIFVGGTFNDFEKDETAVYYETDYPSNDAMVAYGLDLCELVEAEGAALLMNENDALPLSKGAKVSCF